MVFLPESGLNQHRSGLNLTSTVVDIVWLGGGCYLAEWWLLVCAAVAANWQNSGCCVAVWNVIFPHFLPLFLSESIGRARVVQHRIKSENGFDSVIALFSGFWIKIIRKIIFHFECHNFFLARKKLQKKNLRHLPSTRDLKNSGTRYAPKFLERCFARVKSGILLLAGSPEDPMPEM